MDTVRIQKVDKNTELADKLRNFVSNFSWLEVKDHTVRLIENWEFDQWETPFAAILNGEVVGIATLMKSDYYPLPEIYPWVSTLFVTEKYRGKRISEELIRFANQYAKEIGFTKFRLFRYDLSSPVYMLIIKIHQNPIQQLLAFLMCSLHQFLPFRFSLTDLTCSHKPRSLE